MTDRIPLHQLAVMPPLPRDDKGVININDLSRFSVGCIVCGGTTIVVASAALYRQFFHGTEVQDIWPDASPGLRELLISGTHDECFNLITALDEEVNDV